jgi:protoporphyrin/coproporphyrin ferrochelatase
MPIMPPTASTPPSAPADAAVLLVNLGTPQAPTAPAVRRYLAEFLHDQRVVQLSRWLWCPLLHFVILPLRGPRVAEKYASIWLDGPDGGSPLAVHTRRLAQAVQRELPGVQVAHAMRYGEPAMVRALDELRAAGVRRLVVLPLYPQYSTTTTASVADVLQREAEGAARGMAVELVPDYHDDSGWIAAVADSIRAHRAAQGAGERLLFSFHGIPQRLAAAGDPYPVQCEASFRAIVAALGDNAGEALMSYQSRFGREPWLQPYTDHTLQALARQGVREVDVVCPGFAVDCLETLEEIAQQNAELFRQAGGRTLRYIPCLNDDPAHARALARIAAARLGADRAP